MSTLSEEVLKNIISSVNLPLVLRGFIKNWRICDWGREEWCSIFGEQEIPYRCMRKGFVCDEPCWERRCKVKNLTFRQFINSLPMSEEWMYFDYKYMHQWFGVDSPLIKAISWKQFGFPQQSAMETTLWAGSDGAHTPAHQDTYGVNIVAQVHGRKRWLFFPPEAGGLRPTRVPYEESSVYSELNFYCPKDLEAFNGLTGCQMVELGPGDALIVPQGWWHYVQNIDELNIAANVWIPHKKDSSSQVSEALIKIFVAQLCKDLPEETARLIVNPNEDDLTETPLSVLFLQLETVVNAYQETKRKARRAKRQKTCEGDCTVTSNEGVGIEALMANKLNFMEAPKPITSKELIALLQDNINKYCSDVMKEDDDEVDTGSTSRLCLTKAVIDAYTQSNVIDVVKQNLLARLS